VKSQFLFFLNRKDQDHEKTRSPLGGLLDADRHRRNAANNPATLNLNYESTIGTL
jgi:hypothetical protein